MTGYETCFISTKSWLTNALIIAFALAPFACIAQLVLQTNRFELSAARDESPFEVIPAHENGIFLYRRVGTDSQDHIQLFKLDTAFQEKWKGFLPIDDKFGINRHFTRRRTDFRGKRN